MNRFTEACAIIREIYRLVDRLQRLFGNDRRFTPDGHLVGTFAEVLAAHQYGLELLSNSAPLHDARAIDGRFVQIKATQGGRVAFRGSKAPDHLIVLSLDREGQLTEQYNGPGHDPWLFSGKLQRNGQRSIGLTRLRHLNGAVPSRARIGRDRSRP